jgi:hypothetical protein
MPRQLLYSLCGVIVATLLVCPDGTVASTATAPSGPVKAKPALQEKGKINVQVTVSSSDDDTKAGLAHVFQSEMIALKDVELVTEKPNLMMEMIGVTARNDKKEPVLFVVSVLVTQHYPSKKDKELVRKRAFYVQSGHDLQVMAKEIVDRFDKEQLSLERNGSDKTAP